MPVRREMSDAVRLDASGPKTSRTRVARLSVVSPPLTLVTSPFYRCSSAPGTLTPPPTARSAAPNSH